MEGDKKINSLRYIIDVTIDLDVTENIKDKDELIAQMTNLDCNAGKGYVADKYLSYMILVDKDGNQIEEWML